MTSVADDHAAADAAAKKRQSMLPAWLVKSQELLASVEISSARARASISRLDSELSRFDDVAAADAPAPAPAAAAAPPRERTTNGPHLLPEELGARVATYMSVPAIVVLSACCQELRRWFETDLPWLGEYERRRLAGCWWIGLPTDDDDDDDDDDEDRPYRRAAVLHISFLNLKAAAFVEHAALVASNAGGSQGRRKAHGLLEALVDVTAAELRAIDDSPTDAARAVVKSGGLAALASLAGSESRQLGGLAAAAVANCLAHPDVGDEACAVLEGCGGRCALTSCLTSPSAKVALHTSLTDAQKAILYRVSLEDADAGDLGVVADATSQSCQGAASKAAARALCNWCAVPEGAPTVAAPADAAAVRRRRADAAALAGTLAAVAAWELRAYRSDSGELKVASYLTLALDGATGRVSGAGQDERGKFDVVGARHDASMVAFACHYHEFGTSTVGHFAYVLWAGNDAREGLFGIWEVASHDSHFALRSGGPCRCLPADAWG